jgi:predicted O-linked N-acetylglucosamine transferase (SPINDLY family)
LKAEAKEYTSKYPEDKRGWDLLGAAYVKNSLFKDAIQAYSKSIELAPNDVTVLNNYGIALRKIGNLADAIIIYKKVISLDPNLFSGYINLATVLIDSKMIKGAIDVCEFLLKKDPLNKDVYGKLAYCYQECGEIYKAAQYCKLGIKNKPEDAFNIELYSSILGKLAKYENVFRFSEHALNLIGNDQIIWESHLFSTIYNPYLTEEKIVGQHIKWGGKFYSDLPIKVNTHINKNSKIKIGYLSPDFRNHSCRFYFQPLFENHNKSKFELFAISNVPNNDSYTEKFKKCFDHWQDIKTLDDDQVQKYISDNKIDILVDACGHMRDHRLGVFAGKPAPIQVTWLGAAWTTGLPQMDYALFDPYMAPPETLASEKIFRLPKTWASYRPSEASLNIKCTQSPVIVNKFISFGYTGRTERLNEEVFRAWSTILNRVKGSRLILDYGTFAFADNNAYFTAYLQEFGISSEMIQFKNSSNIFEGLGDVDILLDSFPHSGGTMLYDAAWMSLPIVTLSKRAPVGRIGTSILNNIGIPELIANNVEEYIDIAVDLANDIDKLILLRSSIRQRMIDSPIRNEVQFAQDMENTFLEILDK